MNPRSLVSSSAVQCLAFAAFLTFLPSCETNPRTQEQAAQPAAPIEPVLHASIDTPAPESRIKNKVVVAGWAFASGAVVQEISVFVDGKRAVVAAYGGARPDVAKQFPEPGAAQSGWYTELDGSTLSAGKHEISVRAILAGGAEKPLGTVSVTR